MNIKQLANNQVTVTTEKGTYLQSYDSVVVFRPHQGVIEMGERLGIFKNYNEVCRAVPRAKYC